MKGIEGVSNTTTCPYGKGSYFYQYRVIGLQPKSKKNITYT